MLASLLLDSLGLLGVPREPLRVLGLVGVAAVLTGAALIVRAQVASPAARAPTVASITGRVASAAAVAAPAAPSSATGVARAAGPAAGGPGSGRARWPVLGVLGGAVLPVQGAINARLRADLDAPIVVAALSFLLATAAMALVLAVALRFAHASRPQLPDLGTARWWGWLGGPIGAIYVTSVFLLIPRIGAASTVALTVAGQQLASVAVDQYGLLRLPHRPVTGHRLLGVGVLLAGVAVLQLT
jgi:transporter family-2 protein